jgi:hypothetical protein
MIDESARAAGGTVRAPPEKQALVRRDQAASAGTAPASKGAARQACQD